MSRRTIPALFLAFASSGLLACSGGASGGTGGIAGTGGAGGTTAPPEFEEFTWRADEPDVRSERLCAEAAAPDDASDTTFIDCQIEGATFATEEPTAKDELVVLAYNILRGFEVDAQLEMIRSGVDFPVPDILLLSEVDRGCARTDFRNIAREYAEGLGYYYLYATEFLELPGDRGPSGPYDPPVCEHGNAIVSRYPLGNARQIRHAQNRSWYMPPSTPNPDEPRLGGRIAIAADAKIGTSLVRLYVLHLESTLSALDIRDAQAEEIAADSEGLGYPTIAGGDFNTFFYFDDLDKGTVTVPAVKSFIDRGYADAHQDLDLVDRYTSADPFDMVIDLIFARGLEVVDAGRCPPERCASLSDHLPVFVEVSGILGD